MSDAVNAPAPSAWRKKRVLIIEDTRVAADYLKSELENRRCECVQLICNAREEFEADFEKRYPPRSEVPADSTFDGTILDVIFDKVDGVKQREGGRDLYQWLRASKAPCILDHLGKVLVISNHHDPVSAFEEIEAFEGPYLQFSVKNHSRIVAEALDAFVASL